MRETATNSAVRTISTVFPNFTNTLLVYETNLHYCCLTQVGAEDLVLINHQIRQSLVIQVSSEKLKVLVDYTETN